VRRGTRRLNRCAGDPAEDHDRCQHATARLRSGPRRPPPGRPPTYRLPRPDDRRREFPAHPADPATQSAPALDRGLPARPSFVRYYIFHRGEADSSEVTIRPTQDRRGTGRGAP
jgi:hypothetical protein